MRSLIIVLSLVGISYQDPTFEVVETIGSDIIGGLEDIVAKVMGVAAQDDNKCFYNCDGWPYKQCRVSSREGSATCNSPFTFFSTYGQICNDNYPYCFLNSPSVPSGCQSCDDFCSSKDGNRDKYNYSFECVSEPPEEAYGAPAPPAPAYVEPAPPAPAYEVPEGIVNLSGTAVAGAAAGPGAGGIRVTGGYGSYREGKVLAAHAQCDQCGRNQCLMPDCRCLDKIKKGRYRKVCPKYDLL